ncbi:hypothetical protein HSX11_05690 [Oxalobacteraceae bacterium]|nr:hypothetical protein [Oxalobacteraceae bacterium]
MPASASASAPAPVPAQPLAPMRVSIGEFHLSGYSRRDGERLSAAFQSELQTLLGSQPRPQSGFQMPVLALPSVHAHAQERPEQTGRRLARAIARSLAP